MDNSDESTLPDFILSGNMHRDFAEALDRLLKATVDQDMEYGITLTEEEMGARTQALAVLQEYGSGPCSTDTELAISVDSSVDTFPIATTAGNSLA
jgi:hypothetical protein